MPEGLYKVENNSWSVTFSNFNRKLEYKDLRGYSFRILNENCRLPYSLYDSLSLDPQIDIRPYYNDTIIQNIDTEEISFVDRKFLIAIETHCPTCGRKL